MIIVAAFLFFALSGDHPTDTPIRAHIVENGMQETGALNLVTAVYLGYRAFDTLGETIVLLLAVSGVVLLVEHGR
jgi:multicomponent Na+:H+ antiporter subunit B